MAARGLSRGFADPRLLGLGVPVHLGHGCLLWVLYVVR